MVLVCVHSTVLPFSSFFVSRVAGRVRVNAAVSACACDWAWMGACWAGSTENQKSNTGSPNRLQHMSIHNITVVGQISVELSAADLGWPFWLKGSLQIKEFF